MQRSQKDRGQPDRLMDGWTDRRTDILYWHSGDLNPWPAAACAAHNYGPRKWSPKRDADDHTETQKDGHISSTGTHWVPLDPSVGIKYYCRYYTAEPVACGYMRCMELWAVLLWSPKGNTGNQIEWHRYRETDRPIISTGPHWGWNYLFSLITCTSIRNVTVRFWESTIISVFFLGDISSEFVLNFFTEAFFKAAILKETAVTIIPAVGYWLQVIFLDLYESTVSSVDRWSI